MVKCEAGRALPPADRLAAFVPFEKHLRRLSDARSAKRGRFMIEAGGDGGEAGGDGGGGGENGAADDDEDCGTGGGEADGGDG